MARANRLVIDNGYYHITSRIANQEYMLRDSNLKDKIVRWIYGIADFSGVEVLSWCIMNNHFHLFVHIPNVPRKYWLEKDMPPKTTGFSMRPAECRAPRWTPNISDTAIITSAGDSPSINAINISLAEGIPVSKIPHPKIGFMLSDEEMIKRIKALNEGWNSRKSEAIKKRWETLRKHGCDDEVDAQKELYCHRMYNISQFMKTFKQRISQYCNVKMNHSGHLWSDRFHSVLVENEEKARIVVASYIDLNPMRAKLVSNPKDWGWCSYSYAVYDSEFSARARKGYEKIFGCEWNVAQQRMETIFARKDSSVTHLNDNEKLQIMQAIRSRIPEISHGGYVSQNVNFASLIIKKLPKHFPGPSKKSLYYLSQFDWLSTNFFAC